MFAFWELRRLVRHNTNRHFGSNINRRGFFSLGAVPAAHSVCPHQTPLTADTDQGAIKKQRVNEVQVPLLVSFHLSSSAPDCPRLLLLPPRCQL